MRIVYIVASSNLAGGEMVCLHTMRCASEQGHSVCLIAPAYGPITDLVESEGHKVVVLPLRRTFHIHQLVPLARFLREWQADLVHSHDVLQGVILGRLGAYLAGVHFINHVHLIPTFNQNPVIRALQIILDRMTARVAGPIIAVSEDTKRGLVSLGLPASRILVVPNGVEIPSLANNQATGAAIRAQFGIESGAKLVGCVARLDPMKGQRDLLAVVPNILKAIPEAEFLFVGQDMAKAGQYQHELEQYASELGVSSRVHFVGYQSDAARIMHALDVFVLPSYVEAMPLTILEAMAAAKPVVATCVNGVPEVVVHDETGRLVPPGDLPELVAAIVTILRNPDYGRALGRAGRERAENSFDLHRLNEKVFSLYEKVVHG